MIENLAMKGSDVTVTGSFNESEQNQQGIDKPASTNPNFAAAKMKILNQIVILREYKHWF